MSKPLPPPIVKSSARANGPPPVAQNSSPMSVDQFGVSSGLVDGPQRVLLYGPGGIGKSTLASLVPGRTVVIDVENGTRDIDLNRISNVKSYDEMRFWLQSSAPDAWDTIWIDTGTKLEEYATAKALATIPHEKTGQLVASLELYGWGKGYQHVYDTFLYVLADLDRLVERGKNVGLICHACVDNVPNPAGDDFIRYEPHLQSSKSGKASIRNRVVQWADHVLFIGYDVFSKDGKGKGSGTRTIWPQERPDHVAKSRKIADPVPWNDPTDGSLWTSIVGGAS
jgi:hypothetical protein